MYAIHRLWSIIAVVYICIVVFPSNNVLYIRERRWIYSYGNSPDPEVRTLKEERRQRDWSTVASELVRIDMSQLKRWTRH